MPDVLLWRAGTLKLLKVSVCGADVALEVGMNDNLLTGTIPAELQYLPMRVSHPPRAVAWTDLPHAGQSVLSSHHADLN